MPTAAKKTLRQSENIKKITLAYGGGTVPHK